MNDLETVYVCSFCSAHVELQKIRYVNKKSDPLKIKQVCLKCSYMYDPIAFDIFEDVPQWIHDF